MRLAAAASYFDKTSCADAFNAGVTFKGQLDLFDDSRRDGATVVRRILSVAPAVTIPARRVLTIHSEQWIVGMHEVDSFRGAVIRDKHVLHRADGVCLIQTVAQLLSTGGTSTYGGRLWVKDAKEPEQSSRFEGFFNVYLPSTETVVAGQTLSLAGRLFEVRNFFTSAAGFLVAEANELAADAMVSGTFTPRTYTPATDVRAGGTPVTLNVLRLRWHNDYLYASASSAKYEDGDIKALVRKAVLAAAARANDLLTLPDGGWRVVEVADEGLCWGLHLRRAGA